MSETPVVQEPVVTPEPPKEYRYEYQPSDGRGNPLGGKQVIIYDGTPEDLGRKMAEQNSELVRLNRELNKKVRLSTSFQDEIPETAQRFDPSKYDLKPEPLTAEERMQLAQDIQDPEKFSEVSRRIVRAEIGDPEALRNRISRIEQKVARSNVHEEAVAFRKARPEYYPTPDNLQTLAAWIEKNNLDPIKENFELAFDNLKDVLEPWPPKTEPKPAPAAEPAKAVDTRPVTTGLTRANGSSDEPVRNIGITRAELDKMSGDEYKKRLLHEKGFREKVEALDRQEAERRATAGRR